MEPLVEKVELLDSMLEGWTGPRERRDAAKPGSDASRDIAVAHIRESICIQRLSGMMFAYIRLLYRWLVVGDTLQALVLWAGRLRKRVPDVHWRLVEDVHAEDTAVLRPRL